MHRFSTTGRSSLPVAALCLIATIVLGACSTTIDATTLGVPATLASAAGQPPAGAAFRINTHSVFGLWGLAQIKKPSVDKILASQLVGGKSIANVRIRIRSRWSDLLITALTAGIIVPRSVSVEGVVVQ